MQCARAGRPVRQWVLTLPHRLRYALAWDHKLCRLVLGIFIRALLGFERRRAGRRGMRGGRGGAVTSIQRFGSSVNLNVHFHTIAPQGVFVPAADGVASFVPTAPPTDDEVARLLASVRRRVVRLVKHHGIDLERPSDEVHPTDLLALEFPALAAISSASVVGRMATGEHTGVRLVRIGRDPNAAFVVSSSGPRQAHLDGFDLHANVAVPAGDHERLEHLVRYVLRPPVAQDALELTSDGQVLLKIPPLARRHPRHRLLAGRVPRQFC